MLSELRISNFAIIHELSVIFGNGLNIITGETGAGKSIIVNAVGLLLGDRASSDLIRSKEDSAQVEAVFTLEGPNPVMQILDAAGIDVEGDVCIRRIISRSGRNRAYINGTSVTLAMLSSVTELLINICGQHEHQAILDSGNHIDILDEYAGLLIVRQEYRSVYQRYLELRKQIEHTVETKSNAQERADFVLFQLSELEAAAIIPGEDTTLAEERLKLTHVQKLQESAAEIYDILYGRSGSVMDEFSRVVGSVKEICRFDPRFVLSLDQCNTILYQMEDMARVLRQYTGTLTCDPQRLAEVEERLELLGRLKRKYGASLGQLAEKKMSLNQELTEISSLEDKLLFLEGEVKDTLAFMRKMAGELNFRRREAAKRLSEGVDREIHSLNMSSAAFVVSVADIQPDNDREAWDDKGSNQVEFLLRTNLGEDLKPLNRVASGGELSRIILALKKVLAHVARIETVVFDEVDSGIGGATAQTVGVKLRETADYQQVLCITHLPQIACFGHHHYLVAKAAEQDRTITSVELLTESGRLDEVARMLGGVDITEKTLAHAAEMLHNASVR